MMPRRRELAQQGLGKALRVRRDADLGFWQPICVFDLAETLGVEVRFVDVASMEGMYYNPGRPIVLVTAHRPPGRQAFTCAHELGHHVFGHSSVIDESVGEDETRQGLDREEFVADCFAGFLLMPKTAVCRAFSARGWDATSFSPEQGFVVAGQLGVSYAGLIYHLRSSLRLLLARRAGGLLKVQPKKLRAQILGEELEEDLIVVDSLWCGRSIDIQVKDLILAPADADFEGACVARLGYHPRGTLFRGLAPGLGRLHNKGGWAAFVRVSRRGYVGRSVHRHLEDPDNK